MERSLNTADLLTDTGLDSQAILLGCCIVDNTPLRPVGQCVWLGPCLRNLTLPLAYASVVKHTRAARSVPDAIWGGFG